MAFQKITESESLYDNLDQMSVRELLEGINNEDRKVAIAVGREIPKIEKLVTRIVERMRRGGGAFYIGGGEEGGGGGGRGGGGGGGRGERLYLTFP